MLAAMQYSMEISERNVGHNLRKSAVLFHVHVFSKIRTFTVMRRITTFRSTMDRIYDGGPTRFYYNTIVLQLPTVFSRVTWCTCL